MAESRQHDRGAEPPWYRQFWPWFIIAVPAAAVVGSMITIFLAVTRPDSLVVDDYSRIGELTAEKFRMGAVAREFGLEGRLSLAAARGEIELRLGQSSAAREPLLDWPDTLLLELSHPTLPARDLDILLTRTPMAGSAVYRARLSPLEEQRWYASVQSLDGGAGGWRLTGEISEYDSSALLRPAGHGDDG